MAELTEGQRALQIATGFECPECYDSGVLVDQSGYMSTCAWCGYDNLPNKTGTDQLFVAMLPIDRESLGNEVQCARALVRATAARPVRNTTLGVFLRVNEREVKRLIEVLRNDWHLPIGSLRVPPYGYYWISTPEEFMAWFGPMKSQALSELRTAYRLAKRHYPELAGQLTLPLDTDFGA